MTLGEIKLKLIETIEQNREEIISAGEEILKNPELGYKEEKTSALLRKKFKEMGIEYEYPFALTGVKAKLLGRAHKYNICIIGEMDAVKCAGETAHACGHNAQVAGMLGAAIAFKKSGIMRELDGDVTFMAVPAEEFIDLEYRKELKEQGKIKYFGGKQQLIAEGAFDDVDIAMMIHARGNEEEGKLFTRAKTPGFVAKTITFRGKAAHGSTPYDGVNALNAAALAILGVHSNRETFKEEEQIRIHPIITKGGDVVNSVPDEVCIDTYIRGASVEAIEKGTKAVERACTGAAQMVGAGVEFYTVPGYLPRNDSRELSEIFENNAKEIIGEENVTLTDTSVGSSDIGDLSYILPTIQPELGGFKSGLHSVEFKIADFDAAYVIPAKLMATAVAELLYDGAEKAGYVKEKFVQKISKEDYINYLNNNKRKK